MKKLILMIAAAAMLASACGAPATNAPANTNANAAKPTAAAPTADALLALDKAANDAYIKGDGKYFEGFLSDKFLMFDHGQRMDKTAVVKNISGIKCVVKDGWTLTEPAVSKINDDTYALTYKSNMEGSCTLDGKSEKAPSPVRAASIFVRNGDKWQGVFHAEDQIIEPKGAAPASNKAPAKEDDPKASAKSDDLKAVEPKAAEPKAAEPKKDEKPAANAAAAPAPVGPTKSANTDALAKAHAAGWEAFRNKDAKAFDAMMTSTFAGVNPLGGVFANKADTIKTWTETMKCEGITKTSFNDAFSVAISPTVEILTGTGKADGKCDGQANGDLAQAAVYVKEGETWKLAFMFEYAPTPAK